MLRNTKVLSLLLILFAISFSCTKKETHWKTDVLIPILKTEMGMDDLFGEENIASNPDQSLSIVIEEKLDILSMDSIVDVGDTITKDVFNVPLTFIIPPGKKVIEKETWSRIDFGDMELTMARAERAKMKFYVTNSIKQPLLVKYELYSATKDGVFFEVEERVEAATDTDKSYAVKEILLDGYDIDLRGPNNNDVNIIYARTTVWIHADGDTAVVTPDDTVMIVSTFDEFIPSYATGYLGMQQMSAQSSSAINTFRKIKSGSFDLKSAKANLEIYNYVGVDLSMEINELSTKNNSTNTEINLNHSIIGTSLNIDRASESGLEDYPVWAKHYSYDISNSNLDNMIEIMPDSFYINVKAVLNPLGNISAGNDFIYFDKGIDGVVKLEVPLNFSASQLVIEDEVDLNFDDENVSGGILNVFMNNSYPFDLDIQFYIIDNQNVVVDSLFMEGSFIAAGIMGNSGVVIEKTETALKVNLNDRMIDALSNNDRIRIRAKINSPQQIKYKLYEFYSLDIKIVGDFEYEI